LNQVPQLIGHNTHQYEVLQGWGNLDPEVYPVADCHEMAIDKAGRIFLLTNEAKNNILIYNNSGKLVGSWGNTYPGAHGLSIAEENGSQFLLITDIVRHQVIKTTLDGKELFILDYPKEIAAYQLAEQFSPTETAVAPNGDIYVTDGYGLQFVIQYNNQGEYISHWGGFGNADDKFDCAHGIAVDDRDAENPTLLITSRNHNAFKRFALDGKYLETISLPDSFVCRPVIKGRFLYTAVFRSGSNTNLGSGYIIILDEQNKVVSTPGGSAPEYVNGLLQPQHQSSNVFIHPHDVCVDNDDNIIVCQWKSNKTYPIKLKKL
jgi:peptidylamidoglycolate lyase